MDQIGRCLFVTAYLEILGLPMGCTYQYRNIFAWFKASIRRKQNLANAFGIQLKRKSGVTMHFSEMIKLQFEKKRHIFLCILLLFRIIVTSIDVYLKTLSLKNGWLPQFSFCISKNCFSRIFSLTYVKSVIKAVSHSRFQMIGQI